MQIYYHKRSWCLTLPRGAKNHYWLWWKHQHNPFYLLYELFNYFKGVVGWLQHHHLVRVEKAAFKAYLLELLGANFGRPFTKFCGWVVGITDQFALLETIWHTIQRQNALSTGLNWNHRQKPNLHYLYIAKWILDSKDKRIVFILRLQMQPARVYQDKVEPINALA